MLGGYRAHALQPQVQTMLREAFGLDNYDRPATSTRQERDQTGKYDTAWNLLYAESIFARVQNYILVSVVCCRLCRRLVCATERLVFFRSSLVSLV